MSECVASSSGPAPAQDALAQRVVDDIAKNFGPLPSLRWHRVIAEKRATFSCTPDLARPATVTACKNFFLAGDYTAGDYPATLEAAIRSGRACAAVISAWKKSSTRPTSNVPTLCGFSGTL